MEEFMSKLFQPEISCISHNGVKDSITIRIEGYEIPLSVNFVDSVLEACGIKGDAAKSIELLQTELAESRERARVCASNEYACRKKMIRLEETLAMTERRLTETREKNRTLEEELDLIKGVQ
jgi:hypothetical protein